MTDTRCLKCKAKAHSDLCGYCVSKLTSLHAHVALAQGKAITTEQRAWLFKWFLQTKYFAFHRRMSRGRAKKLINFMGSNELNLANVLPRGPHDPVTDIASQPIR